MIKSMQIPEMEKVYYWTTEQWCKSNMLQETIDKCGLDYHITHVYKTDSDKSISELVQQLIH